MSNATETVSAYLASKTGQREPGAQPIGMISGAVGYVDGEPAIDVCGVWVPYRPALGRASQGAVYLSEFYARLAGLI